MPLIEIGSITSQQHVSVAESIGDVILVRMLTTMEFLNCHYLGPHLAQDLHRQCWKVFIGVKTRFRLTTAIIQELG